MFKYCTCGAKNEYSVEPPHFCQRCGIRFSSNFTSVSSSKPKIALPKRRVEEEELEEEDYENEEEDEFEEEEEVRPRSKRRRLNLDMREILAGTEIHSGYSGVNIKDVAGTKDNDSEGFRRDKPKKMSQKQALEEFRRLATPKRQFTDLDSE